MYTDELQITVCSNNFVTKIFFTLLAKIGINKSDGPVRWTHTHP